MPFPNHRPVAAGKRPPAVPASPPTTGRRLLSTSPFSPPSLGSPPARPAWITSTLVAVSLPPAPGRHAATGFPHLPSAAPSSQTKEDATRSSHNGGVTRLLVDAACVDDSTARAAPSIMPVRGVVLHAAAGAGDQEVDLLVPETPPSWGLSASASKRRRTDAAEGQRSCAADGRVSPWPARAAWSASKISGTT
nr:uncharacterized protein LOC127310692 [Lolium perenne]